MTFCEMLSRVAQLLLMHDLEKYYKRYCKWDAYKPNCDFNGVCIDLITLNCGIETEFLV